MFKPVKVIDIELACPIKDIEGLENYGALKGLIRFHGAPIGYVTVPLSSGRCTADSLIKAIAREHSLAILRQSLRNRLAMPLGVDGLRMEDLIRPPLAAEAGPHPVVTVAVCSRDRTASLAICLDSLIRLTYPALDLLVVDNAPSNDTTEALVRAHYPNVRYVCEPRPGLNWARNRAITEARGEIIAYTDDDVVVDPQWASALARVFAQEGEVMAVTGLVVPYELETESQMLFEKYGGFGRGFDRKRYRLGPTDKEERTNHIGAGRFGTGANMAFRRRVFDSIGVFDPALDVGTPTHGGGDLEMFFRVLQEGYTLVYEPNAIVRHRHRRDYASLRTQLANNGIGFYSYLVRSALAYSATRFAIIRFGLWWKWWWNIRRLLNSFLSPKRFPRDLIVAEFVGSFAGLVRYPKARRAAAKIARSFGSNGQKVNCADVRRVRECR